MSDSFKFLDEGSELQIIVEGDRDLPHIDPASQTTSLFDRYASNH
ncbi:hypothetical protein [Microcoleus sp.]